MKERIRKPQPAPFRRCIIPLLFLGALSLYGGWFLSHAQTAASSLRERTSTPQSVEAEALPADRPPASVLPQGDSVNRLAAATPIEAATAASSSGGASCAQPPSQTLALGFRSRQWLELTAAEEAHLDSGSLTVSAWVRLAPPDDTGTGEPASIQTIVATKASGCDVNSKHHGFSLFVNAWNTENGQVFFSWGNSRSGCEELATEKGLVHSGRWAFIAASVDERGDAALFVDGVLRAHTSRAAEMGERRIVSTSSPIDRGAAGSAQHNVRVGAHTDDTHPLRGHLAAVAIHPAALDEPRQRRLMCAQHARVQPAPLVLLTPKAKAADGPGGDGEREPVSIDPISEPPGALTLHAASGQAVPPTVSSLDKLSTLARRGTSRARALGGGTRSTAGQPTTEPLPNGWPLGYLPGKPLAPPDAAAVNASDALALDRRRQVKGVMQRAWSSYRKYAWGADELKPVSNRSHDWLRLGATLVDCLDNLWIMGMHEEFREAREWVATRLSFNTPRSVSMFETVIRILGGLLSAYELSKDQIFLTKSTELADKMMYAFTARSRYGLPCTTISLTSSSCSFASWTGQAAVLAEFGTIQLEFKYLAHHTGQQKYWDVAQRIMDHMRKVDKPHGLYPVFMSPSSGTWSSQKITLGALGDSFYEYLIKQWLITNKKESYLREMFDEAMVAIARKLVQRSTPSGYVYIADWQGATLTHKMDHLACFAGAMYAVGAQDGGQYDAEYMALAGALSETCYRMYTNTATGLSPEFVQFQPGRDLVTPRTACYNIGRPEAVEAWFYMWYYTRDPKWRDMGWHVFEAFEKYAATGSGWTALPDVDAPNRKRDDKMESFVLAETVKYFYLLFDPSYPIPLEKYVFNTEAHPLGRFNPM